MRRRRWAVLAVALALCGGAEAAAQPAGSVGTGRDDVVLEVPELAVDSIGLTVQRLRARVSLDANVARLVSITAGADVRIREVELLLTGVAAEAYLYVDLDDVVRIADRVLATLDRNAGLLVRLLSTTSDAVGTLGSGAAGLVGPDGAATGAVRTVGEAVGTPTRPRQEGGRP
jgi:hypothetical protein